MTMTQYTQELRVFNKLKDCCNDETRREFERAIVVLHQQYNTVMYENRFIVGGAVKVFTCALLRSVVGIDCTPNTEQSTSGDILLPNDKKLSVKSSFTGGASTIKLMNKQGGREWKWDTATLFVLSGVGIVFGAPDMVPDGSVKDVKDGFSLDQSAVESLMEDANNIFQCSVAKKQSTDRTGNTYTASTSVARQIIKEAQLTQLEKALNLNDMPKLWLGYNSI